MSRSTDAWTAVVFAVTLRAALIALHPQIFGGDSVVRLANADRVLLSYNLPLLQALLYGVSKMSGELIWVRALMVAGGAIATAGVHRLALQLLDRRAALWTALLFASSPFITAYSLVPYQEIFLLGGLAWAFALWLERRPAWASLALGLACLTRYEAWVAVPVIVAADWLTRPPVGRTSVVRLAALYGWAPALWIALHGGLTPGGTFAVDALSVPPERLWRWAYLGWITLKNTPIPVALLAAAGLGAAWRARRSADRRLWALPAFLGAFALAVLFSAHGERDEPDRFVTAREAELPLAGAILLAGAGLALAGGGKRQAASLAALGALGWSIVQTERFTAAEASRPRVELAWRAAEGLNERMEPDDTVVVLAAPVPRAMLERYLELATRQGGEAGRAAALVELTRIGPAPPDAMRVRVQVRPELRRQVHSLAAFPADLVPATDCAVAIEPDWALAWSDFEATSPKELQISESVREWPLERRWEAGDVTLRLFRRP